MGNKLVTRRQTADRNVHSGLRWTFVLAMALFLAAAILSGETVHASALLMTPSGNPAVVDQADLFTDNQEADLASLARRIGENYNQDLVIVTTADAEGKSARDYADDFFDYEGYGLGTDFSGMLFLIDMDNREIWLSTTGHAIDVMTDQRINTVLDRAVVPMRDEDYAGAARIFLEDAEHYLELGVPEGQYREEEKVRSLGVGEIIVSIAAAGGVFAVYFFSVSRRYRKRRMTWNYDLSKMAIAEFPVFSDRLVNKFVRTRRVPRQTSSGGSGGGGRSSTHSGSSGRTHGGGGRGF